MLSRYALSVCSLALFGSAVGVTKHQQALAEQQFKNIQSFKGSKADDIVPAMEFMSASLGVSCDYCHVADKASDEKRAKGTARMMIAMQRDINAKNFDGRNQVTCATCHAGHTRPAAVPPMTGSDVRSRRSADVNPAQVLAAYAKASGAESGGEPAAYRVSATSKGPHQSGNLEATYSGTKMVMQGEAGGGHFQMGYEGGATAWYKGPQGTFPLPLASAAQAMNQWKLYFGPASFPKLTSETGATAKIGDRAMLVVSGPIEGQSARLSLYFDQKTGLLARVTYAYLTILGNILQTTDCSDYRRMAGLEVPTSVLVHTSEGDTEIRIRSIRSEKANPAEFEMPK